MIIYPAPIKHGKIRFALVGCGRISKNHFEAIKQHRAQAELIGVCDIEPEILQNAAATTGARSFDSLPALLKNCDADIVVLATLVDCTLNRQCRLPNRAVT
jgi:UDP-N-acetyl-2-amino-2-deoxyglucuronate dehydrogenase